MKDKPMRMVSGNEVYWLSLEEVNHQQDWLDYREYLLSKYGIWGSNISKEETFEKWQEMGKPKAGLWR